MEGYRVFQLAVLTLQSPRQSLCQCLLSASDESLLSLGFPCLTKAEHGANHPYNKIGLCLLVSIDTRAQRPGKEAAGLSLSLQIRKKFQQVLP